MSELESEDALKAQGIDSTDVPLSAGAMLRRAREAAGMHIGALAVMMKIPVKKLEALESDRLDQLPDAVFVRALASSVCRTLHLDPGPVLERLPLGKAPQLQADERGLNAPFRGAGEAPRLTIQPYLTNPTVLVVGLLLLAAFGVYLFPDIRPMDVAVEVSAGGKDAAPETAVLPTPTVGGGSTPETPTPSPAMVASASAHATVMSAAAASAASTSASMAAVPAGGLATKPPMAVVSSVGSDASAVAQDALLIFKARGTTWVKVVDAKFAVLMSKTLVAGEQIGVSGALPLSVVIGRSDLTDVTVRGQPFAVQDVSKDNVARFEVK